MAYNVFISYSTKDIDIVNELRAHLQDARVNVFVAEYSIPAGGELKRTIQNAIRECDHFVLLWSRNSKSSEYVNAEVNFAVAHKKKILPIVLHQDVQLPIFINDLKYLPAYRGLVPSLRWVQEHIAGAATAAERSNMWVLFGVAGLIALAAMAESQ